ncbi:unnamed protein product [Polarella glacialis]|uniref:Uncharacterized protein n=1 Tax=Polarella glacialis TaxID=89957 RepID=A0A813FVR9_POLGL|nr:unnamed protein product [Polarella glacialis]
MTALRCQSSSGVPPTIPVRLHQTPRLRIVVKELPFWLLLATTANNNNYNNNNKKGNSLTKRTVHRQQQQSLPSLGGNYEQVDSCPGRLRISVFSTRRELWVQLVSLGAAINRQILAQRVTQSGRFFCGQQPTPPATPTTRRTRTTTTRTKTRTTTTRTPTTTTTTTTWAQIGPEWDRRSCNVPYCPEK